MSNFKFTVLGFLAMALAVVPVPFALVWGYAAIPVAVVCMAIEVAIVKRLLKVANMRRYER